MAKKFWHDGVTDLLRVHKGFDLRDIDPASTPGTDAGKADAEAELQANEQRLRELQEKLFAQSETGKPDRLLVILQAMDAAGKSGLINHVFDSVEPHGLEVTAFKPPTADERARDFLWRVESRIPQPGHIGLFDRSHYEDVLIQRVREMAPAAEIERRYGAIVDFEQRIADEGVHLVKIMLHISPQAQLGRLLARLDNPEKHWKYKESDIAERVLWPKYMEAFQVAIERTAADHAPWYVVPGDAKWYSRVAVQRIVIDRLEAICPDWPDATFDVAAERDRVEATADLTWP